MLSLSGLAVVRNAPNGLLVGTSLIRRLPVAVLLGTSLYLLVGTAWLLTGMPGFLAPVFGLTMVSAELLGGRRSPRTFLAPDLRKIVQVFVRIAFLAVGIAGLVLLVRTALREVVFEDSYDNTALAGLIVEGEFARARPFLLLTRPPGLALLQAPALAAGALYSIVPLVVLSLATWAVVLDVADRVMRTRIHSVLRRSVLAGTLVALLGMPMVIAQAAHLNTHHLFGGLLLVSVVSIMVVSRGGRLLPGDASLPQDATSPFLGSLVLPLSALVVLRPDGIFYASVGVVVAVCSIARWSSVRIMLLSVGATAVTWWGYLALRISDGGLWGGSGDSTPFDIGSGRASAVAPVLALGSLLVVAALLPDRMFAWSWRSSKSLRLLVEATPPAVLLAFYSSDRAAFNRSLAAIRSNLLDGTGEWTLGVVVLIVASVGVSSLARHGSHWAGRYVVTAFGPLLLALRIAEGGVYRVGWVDSFNRSIIHILPIAVLLLILAAVHPSRLSRLPQFGVNSNNRLAWFMAVLTGATVVGVTAGVVRSPMPYPFITNEGATDAGLNAVLRELDQDDHVIVVSYGELSRAFAGQIASSRSGWTEVVSQSELAQVLGERTANVIIAPECANVPLDHVVSATGAHVARPGVLNPGAQDWRAVFERGAHPTTPAFERWQVARVTGSGAEAGTSGPRRHTGEPIQATFKPPSQTGDSPESGRGVIHHLGTRNADLMSATSRFRNPAALGLVCLQPTSSLFGAADGITDRSGAVGLSGGGGGIGLLHTDADPVASVTLEFGPKRRLDLTDVVLRQRDDEAANLLRGFLIEVRIDGVWTTVARGQHDGGPGEWHEQAVGVALAGADAIRIARDGPNSSGLDYLVFDDLELYGRLTEILPTE
jgi:hypothetical protein